MNADVTATQSVAGLTYLHGGSWLAAAGSVWEPGAQLYDARTLQRIGVPFPIPSPADYVATDPKGTMFSESEQGNPLLWDVDPAHWKAAACQIAGRNLTRNEWQQYLPGLAYRATCPQWPSGQ